MSFDAAVHAQAIELSRSALQMTAAAGSGHPTSAQSLAHITTMLFFSTMRWSPDYPDYPTSDRLVLSEGHAVPIVYAAAAKLGVQVGRDPADRKRLTASDLETLRENGSVLDGHPNPVAGFPLFDSATGSLGQGLSTAAGLGEAARLDALDKRIYCIVGDGEAREGQVTEALDFIIDRNLNNVLPIFNCNEYGQADRVSNQQSADTIATRLQGLGFSVSSIDGHNPSEIKAAFDAFAGLGENDKPMAIVARTVKGWGTPSLQGGGWHGKPPSGEALDRALAELDTKRVEVTSALSSADEFSILPPAEASAKTTEAGDMPAFSETMRSLDMESLLHTGSLATRRAFGIALRALGRVNPDVVSLDADVSNSTFANMFASDSECAGRFIECKIAEQNMISAAVGMSAAGKVPFCSTFARFLSRAYDQIEMAIVSGANIKFIGSHAGVSIAADGPSQMGLQDVPFFRAFTTMKDHRGNPGCYVLQPADAYAAYALTGVMAEYEGACYMRTLRPDTEFLYSEDHVFNLGGFEVLTEGRDVAIVASGYMVHEANKAIDMLDQAGVSATLVDLYSLPFDEEKLLDVINANNGYVISVEDNYGGGIGSAIADALTTSGDPFTLEQMHVRHVPTSARTPDEIIAQCGLSAQDIVNQAMRVLQVV